MTVDRCAAIISLLIGLACSACWDPNKPDSKSYVYTCENPDPDHVDKDGNPDPCHENDDKQPMACSAACVDVTPGLNAVPVALWFGEERALPPCPSRLPKADFNGGAGIAAPYACPECRCSEASCSFGPVVAYGGDACSGPITGSATPPPAWDGVCQEAPTLPIPALGSYSFDPTKVHGCEVVVDPFPPPPHVVSQSMWERTARACRHADDAMCPPGEPCGIRDDELPSGFRSCVRLQGASPEEAACPAAFPESFVFYADVVDTRECAACACAPAGDAVCVSVVSLHQQAACGDAPMIAAPVDEMGSCADPGMPYNAQGVTATWAKNEPGTCVASGGEVTGEIAAIDPAVFCCKGVQAE